MKTGDRFLTKGKWLAIICNDHTVYHQINGGELRTFNNENGQVQSGQVGKDYDLLYKIEYEVKNERL